MENFDNKQIESSDEKDESKEEKKDDNSGTNGKPMSEIRCPICLNSVTNRSITDTCLHEFCFECITEWSRQHNRCPSCRQNFSNILFNIRSDNDFEQMPVDGVDETDADAVNAVLIRMFLFVQLMAIRSQISDQRNTISQELQQLRRRLSTARGRGVATVRERIRDLELIHQQMSSNMNRLDTTARAINPEQMAIMEDDSQENEDQSGSHEAMASNESASAHQIASQPLPSLESIAFLDNLINGSPDSSDSSDESRSSGYESDDEEDNSESVRRRYRQTGRGRRRAYQQRRQNRRDRRNHDRNSSD